MNASTPYSRLNPSAEYHRLSTLYEQHHADSKGKEWSSKATTYPGQSLWPHLGFIRALTKKYNAQTILDYGAGKGYQYSDLRVKEASDFKIHKNVESYWNAKVTCYDAGNPAFQEWPTGIFDGVISTDVLEHCPREDLPWIIQEFFEKANSFVFANIACYPARTVLSSGENAHITIEQPSWWRELILEIAQDFPHVNYYFLATEDRSQAGELITNDADLPIVPRAGALPGNILKAYLSLIKQKLS